LLEAARKQINIVQSPSSRTLVDNLMHKRRTEDVRIRLTINFRLPEIFLYSP
jgi:hypothetical protein